MPTIYAATVLVSALLLFLVQPLIGRYILPWFGGSSAVWSASQLFFQLLLLVGYFYSHVIVRRLGRRRQAWVHGILLTVALALLLVNGMTWRTPITPGDRWAPQSDRPPLVQILVTLTVSVGLPYVVLSTTTPLVQAWFAGRFPTRSPYPLYALSNIGSIAALLAYPMVLEPRLNVQGQAWLWSSGFVLFSLLVVVVVVGLLHSGTAEFDTATPSDDPVVDAKVMWWHPLMWLSLSACGSTLLLGATNQMTQNVATVPLLWVVPLALYLVTFVLAFAQDKPSMRWSVVLLLVTMPALRAALVRANALPILVQLGTYAGVVFGGCSVCHGELARLRPDASRLTSFYLAVSAGGALGGLFVNLIAPMVFDDFWELPLGVVLCWAVVVVVLWMQRGVVPQRRSRQHGWMIILSVIGLVYGLGVIRASVTAFNRATVDATRNFYGTQRVQTMTLGDEGSDAAYRLVHGTTIHGLQYIDPDRRRRPTSYFCAESGVGLALSQSRSTGRQGSQRIAVLGLGAGTLAAYGRSGDDIVFYEVDPQVIAYAQGEGGYFSYLDGTLANVQVLKGDARLSLERQLTRDGTQAYDVIIVDVFSGDSPPVHLLTREALALYLAHLAPDGLLAMNISTTHIDLKPVIAGLAQDAGLSGVVVEDDGDGVACFSSRWVVMAQDAAGLPLGRQAPYSDLQTAFDPNLRLWTDSYSNLVQILTVR